MKFEISPSVLKLALLGVKGFIYYCTTELILFPQLPANTGGAATFGSTAGPSSSFGFGAPSAPGLQGGFNFGGAAQGSTGPSTFAFGPSAGATPAFGGSGAPTGSGEFLELVQQRW